MAKKHQSYKSNPKLRRANIIMPYTQEQIDEIAKCALDPEYFIENYYKIVHVDHGLMQFKPYPYQSKMIRTFKDNRFVITKMPRQSGKSTTVTAYILWRILFHPQQNIAILANKGKLANDLLDKIKLAYEWLPMWLQHGVNAWNRGNIELENGSKVVAAATSSSAIRGGSFNLILLDEFAFVQKNIAEEFFTSVYPTISSGTTTQMIIVSTPKGMNHYYKMWMDAVDKKSDYVPIDVHWSETPGRDQAWKEQQIRNTSEQQFKQEFETEFIGSVDTLINPAKLRSMVQINPVRNNWGVDIYQEPEEAHVYVLCADTSHGVELDKSAFSVIDVTSVPYRVVAKFYDNTTSPMMYPEIIHGTARKYNDAFVLIETNDVGQTVVNALHFDLEYENLLMTTQAKGKNGTRLTPGHVTKPTFGIKMNKQVKAIGCANLKDLIEGDKLITNDWDTIREFTTFIAKKQSYEAEDGFNDDLVMSLVLFGWLVRQQMFKELTNTDVRKKIVDERYQNFIEELLPAFVDYGDGVDSLGSEDALSEEEKNWLL